MALSLNTNTSLEYFLNIETREFSEWIKAYNKAAKS